MDKAALPALRGDVDHRVLGDAGRTRRISSMARLGAAGHLAHLSAGVIPE